MVGYTLRQERERQNLSINDIEEGTSIRSVYIEAIENGEYDKLPGEVYTKGFIKNYANFLGMDADAAVKEFKNDMAELHAEENPPTPEDTPDSAQAPEQKVDVKPARSEKKPLGYSVQGTEGHSSGKFIFAAVILIAVLAGGIWSWLSGSEGDVAKVNPPTQQTQPVNPPEQPSDNSTPVANANPVPTTPNDSVSVQVRFNDRCWVLVTVDGAVVQEGVIEGGQTLSWEGNDNITFRLGDAGAVEFVQDGKSLGAAGAAGEVVDRTFTRN